MEDYQLRKQQEMKQYVQECEQRFGMSSSDFLSYYRDLESHGLEEEYEWYVCLSFLGEQ